MSDAPPDDPFKTQVDWPETRMADTLTDGPTSVWKTVVRNTEPPPIVQLRDELETAAPPPPPTHIGHRYQILGEIARGGMGAVLKGRDCELNRELAVKVLLEQFRDEPEVLRRFFEEAQIGGQLQHPGIVPIYDIGTFEDNRPFFAMKLVRGRTLAELLKERKSTAQDLCQMLTIFQQVSQTVAYAHSKGVIHRDLKPANVMVGAFGEVQVMDWGLAKVLTQDPPSAEADLAATMIRTVRTASTSDDSVAGSVMGTPAYMAPEQARGEIDRLNERADVFGLGAILCEILTGKPAYVGKSHELFYKAGAADLTDAHARLSCCETDPKLIELAKACLSPEPEDRPSNALEVAQAVTAHLTNMQDKLRKSEIARAEAAARAVVEQSRRRLTYALAAAVLLAGLIGGGSWFNFRIARERELNESDRLVGEALVSGEVLLTEAKRAGHLNIISWARALEGAERARDRLAGRTVSPYLTRRVESLMNEVQRGTTRSQILGTRIAAYRALSLKLEEARLQSAQIKDGRFDGEIKMKAYDSAFREAGIDLRTQDPTTIFDAVALRESGQQQRIAASLDDLACYPPELLKKGFSDSARVTPEFLDRIAKSLDPDPFRNRIRDAALKQDREALESLARDRNIDELTASNATLLAWALEQLGAKDAAVDLLHRTWKRLPGDFWLNFDLGVAMMDDPQRQDDALRYLTAAIALRPDSAAPALTLGNTFQAQARLEDAADSYRHALKRKPDLAEAHYNLGTVLQKLGMHDEALKSWKSALRYKPDFAAAHNNIGALLGSQGNQKEAAEAYRQAVRSNPEYALAFANLARSLEALGQAEDAVSAYRKALELQPDLASTHCDLGHCLRRLGRYREALKELQIGHDLGSKQADWHAPSAKWIEDCKALIVLLDRLPDVLKGTTQPKDNADRLALAQVCDDQREYAAAIRLRTEALAHDPKLADDHQAEIRYRAACSSVNAAVAHGEPIASSKLRKQAIEWIREELASWEKVFWTAEPGNREMTIKALSQWKKSLALSSVRDEPELAKLPEDERVEWQTIWKRVDALLAKNPVHSPE